MRFERIHHGTIDSTSERAFAELAAGRARHGDVHIAAAQTAGRGRLGRTWFSPPGEGLYLSVVLLPPPPPWSATALTIAAGLAVHGAARAVGVRGARLKWPNDLVHDGAKLAGVLVETRGLDPARPHYVLGIGLNVRQRAFPQELETERRVTSLARLGFDVTIEGALDAVLAALALRIEHVCADHAALARDFLDALELENRTVRLAVGDREACGTLADVSIERGIVLRCADGTQHSYALEFVRELAASYTARPHS